MYLYVIDSIFILFQIVLKSILEPMDICRLKRKTTMFDFSRKMESTG
jgi:hypothetical protein